MVYKSAYYTEIDDTLKKFDLDEDLKAAIEKTAQQAEDDFFIFTFSLV